MRQRQALVLILLGIITVLSGYCVVASQFSYGPVIVKIGANHGVHVTDLPVVGLWSISLLAGWALLTSRDT